ncbi:MAG: CBS domain-containing protein [Dehalobacterium sp.]
MELIVSHNNIDFDGLASMVAAQKIYPKAQMAFVGKMQSRVQEFMALYKDSINIKNYRTINMDEISRLIIVDTKNSKRIGKFQKVAEHDGVELIIYDHHPDNKDDLQPAFIVSEKIGATTTLLVEKIKQEKIIITPFEATVFALGIYEDTGSLSFSTTTVRDVKSVAWLLEKGADLKTIRNYMERPLSGEQHELFNTLIDGLNNIVFNGVKVSIATAMIPEYVGGLDLLTQKLGEFTDNQAVFTVVKMEDRIHLVGRSSLDAVNVNLILRHFGGGGHEKASSATVKENDLDVIIDKLHHILKESITPEVKAADIMSTPVKTVSLNQSIEETEKIMIRYGHTGFPVVDGEKVVGIISRRDVEKARYHGLGHAPVKGFMSHNIVTIKADTSLSIIEQLMIQKDIGRLPVMEKGKLLGIISRTDVLRELHGDNIFPYSETGFSEPCTYTRENLADRMKSILPVNIFNLIRQIGESADHEGVSVYLVGGMVRDLILGLPNVDLDLVVEGDGLPFAATLAEILPGKVFFHEKFATASLHLENRIKIDIATARTEYYEFPAALPTVETGSLKQDLYRRDFTINAMAISLNRDNWGQLIDYFCGQKDLRQGIIKVLYNLSFVEDPTRIIRCIRFEKRYGFTIESETLRFAREAIEQNFLEKVSFARFKEEFLLILKEKARVPIFKRLKQLGVWERVFPELDLSQEVIKYLNQMKKTVKIISKFVDKFDIDLVVLLVLCHHANEKQVDAFCEKFQWSKAYRSILTKTAEEKESILTFWESEDLSLDTLDKFFKELPNETIIYFHLISDLPMQTMIINYLDKRKTWTVTTSGYDLKHLGIKPGPIYKTILDRVREAKVAGSIQSKDQEMAFIKDLIMKEEIKCLLEV